MSDEGPVRPQAGDVCIGCIHKPDPERCHYFHMGETGIDFKPPHEERQNAKWMLLCHDCFMKYAENLEDHLDAGDVKIGCHLSWPETAPPLTFKKPN